MAVNSSVPPVSGDIVDSFGKVVGDVVAYLKLRESEQTARTEIIEQGKILRSKISAVKELALHAIDKNFAHREQCYQSLFDSQQQLIASLHSAKDSDKAMIKELISINMGLISQTIRGDSSFKGIEMPVPNKLSDGDI